MDVPFSASVLSFACLRREAEAVWHEFRKVIADAMNDHTWRFWKDRLDLSTIYDGRPPSGGAHFPRFVVWSPSCSPLTTIFMSNYQDGLHGYLKSYTKRYDIECYRVYADICGDPEADGDQFYCLRGGSEIRVIYTMLQDKWEFYQEGELLAFEDKANYRRRRIRDRLNWEIIEVYLSRLGWDVRESGFWQSEKDAYFAEKTAWNAS